MSESHESNILRTLATETGKAVYTVRLTMPNGPTHEYTRLIEVEAIHDDADMGEVEQAARNALLLALGEIGPFDAQAG